MPNRPVTRIKTQTRVHDNNNVCTCQATRVHAHTRIQLNSVCVRARAGNLRDAHFWTDWQWPLAHCVWFGWCSDTDCESINCVYTILNVCDHAHAGTWSNYWRV